MSDPIYDDPIWEYVLASKLQPYLPAVKEWWKNYDKLKIIGTGVYPVELDGIECPPGLQMRVTNTPVRSPIKGIQVFPFVPAAYLQITGVPGGTTKMVERVCLNRKFTIEDFTIIEKHNLPSTYHGGQFLCFIPSHLLNSADMLGKYVHLTLPELAALAQGVCLPLTMGKCARYIDK